MKENLFKLKFDVDNLEEIESDSLSSFAKMKIDFFASGDNAHKLYISEETLEKTSKTIYNVPVVWKYDERTDEILGHEKDEVPCGFVPDNTPITSKRLPDGRLMLSTVATIWKKYSGRLIDIFIRDKKKSVSVEMSVLDVEENEHGNEIKDYKFEAITLLGRKYGSEIIPAVPLANAEMLSFMFSEKKEYMEAYEKEFSYDKYSSIDFKIPEELKLSLQRAIENFDKTGKGGNSVSLSNAKFLLKNEKITPDKVRLMYKKLSSYSKKQNLGEDEKVRFELWGGESFSWVKSIYEEMEKIDNKRSAFFVYEDDKKRKEETSVDKEKTEEMAIPEIEKEEEPKTEEMAEEVPVEEKKEEMAEPPVEEKSEEEKEEPKVEMSLDSYLDMPFILRLLEEVTEGEESFLEQDNFAIKCAMDEMKKDGEKSFESISKGMFAKMKMMSSKMARMAEENKAYMSMKEEFESLKAFKKSVEEARFSFEVESTLKDVESVMPKEEMDKAREESKNFSLDTIDGWKNGVKAKAFTFSTGKSKEVKNEIPRWSFNIETINNSKKELWEIK